GLPRWSAMQGSSSPSGQTTDHKALKEFACRGQLAAQAPQAHLGTDGHRVFIAGEQASPPSVSMPRAEPRLWGRVKCEEVYLHAHDSVSDARTSIGRYLDLYNRRRPHSSLDGMTPDQAYFGFTLCCQSAWQPNPGRGSTHPSGKTVRTSGTTSIDPD